MWWGFNPKIRRNIDWLELNQTISAQFNGTFIWKDNLYQVPDEPEKVISESTAFGYDYIPNKRDCDDANRIFRGWLSKKGYGNLLVMDVSITYPNGQSHALIGFLDKDNKLIFGDAGLAKMVFLPEGSSINHIIA